MHDPSRHNLQASSKLAHSISSAKNSPLRLPQARVKVKTWLAGYIGGRDLVLTEGSTVTCTEPSYQA